MTDTTETSESDRDAQSDNQSETDRRSVLRSVGLLGAGLGAGLIGRPAAAAVDNAMKPDKPISSVSVTDGSIHVDLVDRPELSMLRIIGPDDELVIEDLHADMDLAPPVGQSGTYRVVAYRGDYVDPERVQTEEIEVQA